MDVLTRVRALCHRLPLGEASREAVRLLKAELPHYSWLGLYWVEGEELVLGPWEGPEATRHVRIPVGQGICGAAAASGRTELVDDVSKDPRYLQCFARTRSEIVVPILQAGRPVGELDIDSDRPAAFNAADRMLLEEVAKALARAWAREREGSLGAATRAVHSGEEPDPGANPVVPAIHPSANFEFADTAELEGFLAGPELNYLYTRYGNPTHRAAERKLAALEGAAEGVLLSSGMGAIATALLSQLKAGDELVASRNVYGGAHHLFRDLLPKLGIAVRWEGLEAFRRPERLCGPRTRVLYFEPVSNPDLRLLDPGPVAAAAQAAGALTVVDNTFATPLNLRPLERGVDLVLHSTTKYLGGHSDLVGGAALGSRALVDKVRETMILLGTSASAFDAYLLLRGVKTLEVRLRRQAESARQVAEYLQGQPKVRRTLYPGLESHPDYTLARDLLPVPGGVVAFELGGLEESRRVVDALRLFHNAGSLGAVESLVSIPVLTSHHGVPEAELAAAGVSPGLVRLSVGLEDPRDLIEDLRLGLDRLG